MNLVFNSYAFILLFLPLFLIVYYLIGRLVGQKGSLCVITIASFLFYFCCEKWIFLFLLAEIVFNYGMYLMLRKRRSKVFLAFGIGVNILALGFCKYYNFSIDCINLIFGQSFSIRELIVPMGISFITFQQISFLVDVYGDSEVNCNILEFTSFISFFPHISSGPIITTKQFFPEIRKRIYSVDWNNMATGIYLFTIGLAKKVLLADVLGNAVDVIYNDLTGVNVGRFIFATFAYSLQIYFDFSGYSEMAIGISRMINIDIPINFNSPYQSTNILEFWDRWHISLTNFFTRYVYIPLGGSRKGSFRTMLNTIIIFFLSGLWHGASITFVVWGLIHGVCMVITKLSIKIVNKIPKVVGTVFTFCFVSFAWVLFRAGSFGCFKSMLLGMKNKSLLLGDDVVACFSHLFGIDINFIPGNILPWIVLLIGMIIVFFLPNAKTRVDSKKDLKLYDAVWVIVLLLVSVVSLSNVTTYIYSGF